MKKTVTIRGKRWRVAKRAKRDSQAHCDPPDRKGKSIFLPKKPRRQHDLFLTIHELLHAAYFDLDEDAINDGALDIAAELWARGWRPTT